MKSLIVNTLGGKRKFVYLPTTDAKAQTFASTFLDGEFAVYAKESGFGTDSGVTAANTVKVFGRDTTNFTSVTLSFTAKANKSDEEIITALKGKTFNGVKFDDVYVQMFPVAFS